MFKEMCALVLTAGIALPALFAAPPDSAEFLKPERWRPNAAGRMTVTADPVNEAIRFEVDNSGKNDFWFYPIFRLRDGESLDGIGTMRFEYKIITNDGSGTRITLVMLDPEVGNFKPNAYRPYPAATGEWQTAEVSIPGVSVPPGSTGKVRGIRIGANPTSAKVTYLVRRVEFSDRAPASGQLSAELNKAERWRKNSSGDMNITAQGDVVNFEADFSKAKDFWLYPYIQFRPGEVLESGDVLEFDIRSDGDPAKLKSAFIMFCPAQGDFNPKGWVGIPKPTGEWQSVSVQVDSKVQDPTRIQIMRIGLNTNATNQNFQIRNLKVKHSSGAIK